MFLFQKLKNEYDDIEITLQDILSAYTVQEVCDFIEDRKKIEIKKSVREQDHFLTGRAQSIASIYHKVDAQKSMTLREGGASSLRFRKTPTRGHSYRDTARSYRSFTAGNTQRSMSFESIKDMASL